MHQLERFDNAFNPTLLGLVAYGSLVEVVLHENSIPKRGRNSFGDKFIWFKELVSFKGSVHYTIRGYYKQCLHPDDLSPVFVFETLDGYKFELLDNVQNYKVLKRPKPAFSF